MNPADMPAYMLNPGPIGPGGTHVGTLPEDAARRAGAPELAGSAVFFRPFRDKSPISGVPYVADWVWECVPCDLDPDGVWIGPVVGGALTVVPA